MMTDHADPGTRQARLEAAEAARAAVGRAVREVIRETEGGHITDPLAAPLANIRAARRVELAARGRAREHIRAARETGRTWHEIGAALDLGAEAADRGRSAGEAAYDFAAGEPLRQLDRRWFGWTCPACQGRILDRGPEAGHPVDAEEGHADGCERLAATVAAHDAEWADE
jgi:hypothetical protein